MRQPTDIEEATIPWLGGCVVMLSLYYCIHGCGCVPKPDRFTPTPDPISVEPLKPVEPIDQPPLSVAMPESLVTTLHEVLGDAGTIAFAPKAPVKITRPDLSVTFPRGMSFAYTLTDDRGLVTFAEPRPVIEAKAAGLRLTPHLTKVELLKDNTGVATVEGSLYTKTQRFDLRLLGAAETVEDRAPKEPTPEPTLEPDDKPLPVPLPPEDQGHGQLENPPHEKPVVILYSASWCLACKAAKADLDTHRDLPFTVRITDEHPAWVTAFPTLHWQRADGTWSKQVGFSSVGDFVKTWRKSQSAIRNQN